jgi:hypothetical protein
VARDWSGHFSWGMSVGDLNANVAREGTSRLREGVKAENSHYSRVHKGAYISYV